jgi:hypothetical protein
LKDEQLVTRPFSRTVPLGLLIADHELERFIDKHLKNAATEIDI